VAIAETLPAGLAAMLSRDELEAVRQRLTAVDTTPRATLERDDYLGALGVFLLVFVSTLPVVVPFYLIGDLGAAMRTSQAIAVLLLFVTGWRLGAYSGRSPWRTGLVMVAIGVVLSALTYVLGG
jgi:VIT1/CCC1 family predicted Fe2+/Mn2+ transporter